MVKTLYLFVLMVEIVWFVKIVKLALMIDDTFEWLLFLIFTNNQ